MASSNDVQKLFLQAVASRRILSQPLAAKLWLKCIEAVKAVDETLEIEHGDDRGSWDAWVTKINSALNPLDLEFAHVFDEATGKDMYALVNRKGDEIAQLATEYSPAEIAYFKAILEQIMLSPNESFCVSSLAALREVSHVKATMTKTQAEQVLGSLVSRGWLLKSKKGRYSLSTRTVLELQPYLRTTYSDEVLDCTICMEMVTSGYACPTPACKLRLHDHCYNNYRKMHSHCPTCKNEWGPIDDVHRMGKVGERAFKDGQEKGRRIRRSVDDDDEEDGDEEFEEDQSQSQEQNEPSQTQVKKEKTGKGKGKKKAVRDDEDEEIEQEEEETPPPRTQGKRKSRR